uniref:Uncharacterized protein n=1 Tax=Myotis myotis TaxID=51298 RepID=A0A7J7R2C9_MYOMY|nr:hypothetical protein mMyoMyo1_011202 [Myotis myotis]
MSDQQGPEAATPARWSLMGSQALPPAPAQGRGTSGHDPHLAGLDKRPQIVPTTWRGLTGDLRPCPQPSGARQGTSRHTLCLAGNHRPRLAGLDGGPQAALPTPVLGLGTSGRALHSNAVLGTSGHTPRPAGLDVVPQGMPLAPVPE